MAEIRDDGMRMANVFRQRGPAFVDLLEGARFRPADIVFEKEHVLDLGGVTVRIIAMGPNHTPGDTVILVEPDGVLFSGDVAMKFQPSFASPASNIDHWLKSLDRIEALKPKLLVPSHGPTGGLEIVAGYRAYLTDIRDQVAADRRAGRSEAEAIAAVVSRMSEAWPDRARLEGAAKAAWTEAGR